MNSTTTNTWKTLKLPRHFKLSKRELERLRRMRTGSNKLLKNGIRQLMKPHKRFRKNNNQKLAAYTHTDPTSLRLLCNQELGQKRKSRAKNKKIGIDQLLLRKEKKLWKIK